MKNPLKFGLLGCGRIAPRHADVLSKEVPGAELAAVCDIVPQKAEPFGKKYGVPHYSDPEKFLKHPGLEVVNVLTPTGLHAETAILAIRAGKHVVVEKPMALRLEDGERMIREAEKAGTRLFVVKQNRFNLPIVALRKAMEAGRFGKLVLGTVRVRWCRPQAYYDQDSWRGTWKMDGGVFTNQASHHIDMLEWMMGEVQSVYAHTATQLVKIETEDTGVAVLKFRNGALGIVEATTATRPKDLEGSVSVLGEKGTVEVAGFAMNEIRTWNFDPPLPEDKTVRAEFNENPPNVYGYGHREYLRHVVDCIREDKKALVDGPEAMKSIVLINALYESAETGKEIQLRFEPHRSRLGRTD
jgi:UDP-N-acetyl-2-amino-2-deoxyglucuronate dehydrogenase